MKKCTILMLIIMIFAIYVYGDKNDPSYFTINLTPGIILPIGEDTNFFSLGGIAGLSGEYRIPPIPLLYFSGNIGYGLMPVSFGTSLSVISGGAGTGIYCDINKRFYCKAYASGGYYYSFLNDRTGPKDANPYVLAGAGIYFLITPSISLGFKGSYINYLGLYNGIGISLGTAFHFRPGKKTSIEMQTIPGLLMSGGQYLEIKNIEFMDIFPVFFKYYDEHPVGKAILHNKTDKQITDVTVNLFIKQYMDNPKACKVFSELKAGEEIEIELNTLFTEKVLEITESTKSSAEITIDFTYEEKQYTDNYIETIRLYDRNATTWDDDRRAAAFVTAKDPVVLTFSKNIAGIIKEKGSKAVNQNLRMAIALHEALSLYGMSYVIDPKTPYKEFSAKKAEIDFLQFPRQTFQYKAGDCDDLSILYSSLLESVGIGTAFITIPGHIFIAYSIDMTPDEARKSFLRAEDLIFRDNKTWIPVEVTEIEGGFLKAWQTGAKEWREAVAREQEGFYPMHECWTLYEPVGLPGKGFDISVPQKENILNGYLKELISFIDREIYPKIAKIQEQIKKTGGSSPSINRLGIPYAKYGLYDRAEREFQKVIEKDKSFVPVLINLGNLNYLNGDMKKAKTYYEQAYQNNPNNAKILLGVARVNHEMENYGTVKEMYGKLKTVNPELAQQFAYLDLRGEDAVRAAAIGTIKEVVVWEE